MTTPSEAQRVISLVNRAEQAGLRVRLMYDGISICVASKEKFPGFVDDAPLYSCASVEEATGFLAGFLSGWFHGTEEMKRQDFENMHTGAKEE